MKKVISILLIFAIIPGITACATVGPPVDYVPASEEPVIEQPLIEDPATPEPTIEVLISAQPEPALEEVYEELTADAFCSLTEWVRNAAKSGEKNRDHRMAHNIYSDPVMYGTSGSFTTFTIDFLSDDVAKGTYWALCNWNMSTSAFAKKNGYTQFSGGGAYAGLQCKNDGTMAIMSFWEIYCKDSSGAKKVLRANRIYPRGKTNAFGNEGSGTNYIVPYEWESGAWNRMVLHCWEDPETGNTFVGQWVCDLTTGEWTLISYFDTKLSGAYFCGSMSQFMENYDDATYDQVRSFRYKNMYVREAISGNWCSLDNSVLSIDTEYGNKKGSYIFGAEPWFFWGAVCGLGVDQAEVRKLRGSVRSRLSIKQPAEPEITVPSIDSLSASYLKNGTIAVSWKLDPGSTPQHSYEITVLNSAGESIYSHCVVKPEADSCEVERLAANTYRVRLSITDLYGQTVTEEAEVLAD
jgi:hypothetical protein